MTETTVRHPQPTAWARMRWVGAMGAAAILLATVATAPYSMSGAVAAPGTPQDAATAGPGGTQGIRTADATSGLAIDLSIEAAHEQSAETTSDDPESSPEDALYTLEQFMFTGAVNWGGYKFTFYSQQVLPGPGLQIPGRHVNDAGYVSDADGYIVLAGDAAKGTVFPTPFGYEGKIYDRGTVGNHLDVYIR